MKKTAKATRPENTDRNIFSVTPKDMKAIHGGRGIIVGIGGDERGIIVG